MFDVVICNGIIVSASYDYHPFVGSVGIEGDKISYVGSKKLSHLDGYQCIDASNMIVMPGLVNGHCHGDMAFAKGVGDELTLEEQMNDFGKLNWFFDDLTEEDRYYCRLFTYCEALLNGTTLIMENMFWSLPSKTIDAFSKVGIRGAAAEDVRPDFLESDTFHKNENLEKFKQECNASGIIPVFGTLPEEAFSDFRLKKVKKIIDDHDVFYTSHLAETTWRREIVLKNMQTTPVKALSRYGLLSSKYIASHAVQVDTEEIMLMADAGVKVVSTPICEIKIQDGIAPIPEMLEADIVVAVGTDGAMWNNVNDIFRELRCMALLHNYIHGLGTLSAKTLLDMGTINGAKLFDKEEELGAIEEGKLADVITVNCLNSRMQPMRLTSDSVLSNLIFCAQGSDVCDVIVDGKPRVINKQILDVNFNEIIQYVGNLSKRVLASKK